MGVFLPLSFLARWMRHTPGWFWRCPSCRQPFPCYTPDGKLDALRERDCLAGLRRLRIEVVKTKFCPLVIPSECPWCRRKFFAIQGGSLAWDQKRLS
ncbi:MAG: hypothetical protein K2L38_04975 [Dysosmobacter sp.]|nr:hypothetical protein [Dysosmobacter sp.]